LDTGAARSGSTVGMLVIEDYLSAQCVYDDNNMT